MKISRKIAVTRFLPWFSPIGLVGGNAQRACVDDFDMFSQQEQERDL